MFPTQRTLAIATLSLLAAPAFAEFNANIEFDNTYQDQSRGISQGGRVEINAIGRGTNSGSFVAGKASVLAKRDGTVAMDDLWVQAGNAMGDVKLGRFEAADVFQLGRDTIVSRAGSGYAYRTNALRGRFTGGEFHGAGTINFTSALSLELGVADTKAKVTDVGAPVDNSLGIYAKGVRPVLSYNSDGLLLRVGMESGHIFNEMQKFTGAGLTVGYDFSPSVHVNFNAATSKLKDWSATTVLSTTTGLGEKSSTVGINAYLGAAHIAFDAAKNDDEKINTFYASYSFPLLDIKGATITPAFSVSKATNNTMGLDKDTSMRVRINYAF
jgi:hypothetical protein